MLVSNFHVSLFKENKSCYLFKYSMEKRMQTNPKMVNTLSMEFTHLQTLGDILNK